MRASVIDVGSNSIKLLVADLGEGGRLVEVKVHTMEARISKGIGSQNPQMSPEGMERGIAAITTLASEAMGAGSDRISAVATSAVRDASNRGAFLDGLKARTGLDLRILSGTEEANLIARGLATDPMLAGIQDFHAYDLGGGSLECLSFTGRKVDRAISIPLGCVRLTERFVDRPDAALSSAIAYEIGRHVKESLLKSGFELPVPAGFSVVGTGGTLTTVRAMVAANRGVSITDTNPIIGVTIIHELLERVASLTLEGRKALPGLSPERADVFPTALVTLLALAELGGILAFHHSLRNLRWGVAAELLARGAC
jgi:exopolyphosphatase/guanosine-5'-triphosphate,3'-diphosphate pyrophosphatase